jgi:hypothetical protein
VRRKECLLEERLLCFDLNGVHTCCLVCLF